MYQQWTFAGTPTHTMFQRGEACLSLTYINWFLTSFGSNVINKASNQMIFFSSSITAQQPTVVVVVAIIYLDDITCAHSGVQRSSRYKQWLNSM